MDKQQIGKNGEEAAANYLMRKGYVILNRNFRMKFGELDIVALDTDGCTVFVEVKTRKNASFGYPSEYVDRHKRRRIQNMALLYCRGEEYMRFDIIEVYYEMRGDMMYITEINHIEDAF